MAGNGPRIAYNASFDFIRSRKCGFLAFFGSFPGIRMELVRFPQNFKYTKNECFFDTKKGL
jgi:hypothetical protein